MAPFGMLEGQPHPGYVLQEIGWQITSSGLLHVSAFESFSIHEVSVQRITRFLIQTWQQGLVKSKTQRFSWFALPDFDRVSTMLTLRTLQPAQRCHIIREIAGGYQLASQKAKWTHDDPNCSYCGEPDSRPHRLLECPVGQEARQQYHSLITSLQEEDSILSEVPVVIVSPCSSWLQTLHFQALTMSISDLILSQVIDRHNHGHIINWFTDGSATHPESPITRYSAYAIVLDLCLTDTERSATMSQMHASGNTPHSLVTVLASRAQGEQDILRAEMQAIASVMLQSGVGRIHTDCQVAINNFTLTLAATHPGQFMHKEHSDVLLLIWQRRFSIHNTLHKVKAHNTNRNSLPLLE